MKSTLSGALIAAPPIAAASMQCGPLCSLNWGPGAGAATGARRQPGMRMTKERVMVSCVIATSARVAAPGSRARSASAIAGGRALRSDMGCFYAAERA